jgi:excinuclease ABC subunit A
LKIALKKVKVNNLKEISLTLDPFQFIVFTGVSGSGKSSLAFDTIYAEGQRRFLESLPHNMLDNLKELPKPEAEKIEGLSPTIAIEQKTLLKNPRSTVGTITGAYDYLRVLFAKIATPYCPHCLKPLKAQSKEKIIKAIQLTPKGSKITILCPYIKSKKGSLQDSFKELLAKGFTKARLDNKIEELSTDIKLNEKKEHTLDIVIDRLVINEENQIRLAESITLALKEGKGMLYLLNDKQEELFSEHAYCSSCNLFFPKLSSTDFSFNHPLGMCEQCQGLGEVLQFDKNKIIDPNLCIKDGCCLIAPSYSTIKYKNIYDNLAKMYDFSLSTPWKDLSKEAQDVFLYGTHKKWVLMSFYHPIKKRRWSQYVQWIGAINIAKENIHSEHMEKYLTRTICDACHGKRLKPFAREARLNDKTIGQICFMSIEEAQKFFDDIKLTKVDKEIAQDLIVEIQKRLKFLTDVGLKYLTIDRSSSSLSGGEGQRVKLASIIGCGLCGTTYILDEPSIGLHSIDHRKLIKTLLDLRDKKNTIIAIEHDRDTMMAADTIVDMGPQAGHLGGKIMAIGSIDTIINNPNSLTGKYLKGDLRVGIEKEPFIADKYLVVKKAQQNNLKNIDVKIPLNGLILVTGVSGSGKSSLIMDILYPALTNSLNGASMQAGQHKAIDNIDYLDKVIAVDQSSIGKTPRSNPATYIKLFDDIRELFAEIPEAKRRGFSSGHFSFNIKEGSCPYCHGLGQVKIDMDFMEDEWSLCEQCKGKRFDTDVLAVKFKGKNILDILNMEVVEALDFFSFSSKISEKLALLNKVGLGYLKLGQPSTSLSGGEAQRIKLAKELCRPGNDKTLYILDEPTTGLHFADIQKLLEILHEFTMRKSTVIVIEHNIDMIKSADWVIELGPEAGDKGGKIVFQGNIKELLKADTATAKVLKEKAKKTPHVNSKSNGFEDQLVIERARQNNLKDISLKIKHGTLCFFCGPSGSGKTSLALDTIHAEGQRRYIEALPLHVRSLLKMDFKTKVDKIEGLFPSIAIEQKGHAFNPRSTVGTLTEIYDFLRILYAQMGIAYCPKTKNKITNISKEYVLERIVSLPKKTKVVIMAPVSVSKGEQFSDFIQRMNKEGFLRIRLNKTYYELDDKIPYEEGKRNELLIVIDRLLVDEEAQNRILEAIKVADAFANGNIVIDNGKEDIYFNLSFACMATGESFPLISPQTFAFNSEQGMCLNCHGLGVVYGANFATNESFLQKTPIQIFSSLLKKKRGEKSLDLLITFFEAEGIDVNKPLKFLDKKKLDFFLNGGKGKGEFFYKGINNGLAKIARASKYIYKKPLLPFMEERVCPECCGKRLNPLARAVKLNGVTIDELCSFSIVKLKSFIDNLSVDKEYLKEVIANMQALISFLLEIGLSYLSLDRAAPTLSGGELQRIQLARQLGCGLTSCLYILDEPTAGLHPEDNILLQKALLKLKSLGNSLILVEHDPMLIEQGDFIVEFGPKAGDGGGKIMAQGSLEDIKKNSLSSMGRYLKGHYKVNRRPQRTSNSYITIKRATLHNLKNIDIEIPLNVLTVISGVSGSGKSTLLHGILKPAVEQALLHKQDKISFDFAKVSGIDEVDRVIFLSQGLGSQTSRSDVATFTGIMDDLRKFYASLKFSKSKGLTPSFFSKNNRNGMCMSCFGFGYKLVNLKYLPAVKVTCEACDGYGLNPLTLSAKYNEKHLGEVLHLSIEGAKEFFSFLPKVKKKLNMLIDIGLDYLSLDQETQTLSSGELQRIRLANELFSPMGKRSLFLFDEPTLGLYYTDIEKLLNIFNMLLDHEHTIVVIEHNLDFIKHADHIIDLGPGAGDAGGRVIAQGSCEDIIRVKSSYTGQHLGLNIIDRSIK